MKIKRNKEGFTLIEILAVLSILAAVSLIVIPTITGSISNARKKTYKTSASNYIIAVETYLKEQALVGTDIYSGKTICINDCDYKFNEFDANLDYNGDGPDNGNLEIGSCAAEDDKNCYKVVKATLIFDKYKVNYVDKQYTVERK